MKHKTPDEFVDFLIEKHIRKGMIEGFAEGFKDFKITHITGNGLLINFRCKDTLNDIDNSGHIEIHVFN
uniref:Uncharacterized protein n=1 Tax=viral metagenome TaxID=1070528 RepID=A0A6M3J3Z7_9ZZZZ